MSYSELSYRRRLYREAVARGMTREAALRHAADATPALLTKFPRPANEAHKRHQGSKP
jgi:hypothetical protein